MNKDQRIAIIVGATGLVGNELLQILLQSDTYKQVKVLVRTPISIQHPKLTQIQVSFDELERHEEEFVSVHDVFCCLGTTIKKAGSQEAFKKVDFEYPLQAAKLSKKHGVRQFLIITAIGADHQSTIFYNRVKGEVEEALRHLQLSSLHIFHPSLLLGQRREFRLGEQATSIINPIFSSILLGKLKKYKPIQAKDVAQAMHQAALNDRTGQHVYEWEQMAKYLKE
ncbi:hypothetical protein D3C76_225320 [compost metagenome]